MRRRLGALLLLRWLLLIGVLVQVDAMVDWEATRAVVADQPSWRVGLGFGLLVWFVASQEREALSELLYEERNALLWRQPMPPVLWSPAVAVPLIALGLPFVLLALLAYGPTALGMMALALGAWCVPALLAARPAALTRMATGLAAAGAGVVAAAVHTLPALAWPAALVVWTTLGFTLGPIYMAAASRPVVAGQPRSWRPRRPLGALIQRDLLCLWRCDRGVVLACLGGVLPIAGMVLGLRVNGGFGPAGLAMATVIGLAIVAPVGAAALGQLPIRLGAQLDPPSWPVSGAMRFGAWAGLAGLLLAPSWAAAAVVGAPAHPEQLRVVAFVLPACAGAAMFLARQRGVMNTGGYLWWVMLCVPAGLARWSIGIPWGIGLSLFACFFGIRGILARRGHP